MLARDTDNMCNARYNISKDEGREIFELFWNNYRYFEPSLCKTPCTQTTYEVFLNSEVEYEDLTIKFTFEPVVHVAWSVFSVTV